MTAVAADPGAIWRVINGYTAYWTVVTAVELGVFDELDRAPRDVEDLSAALGVRTPRLRVLVDAVVAVGLLDRRDDGRLDLTADSAAFLVRGRERSIRELLLYSPGPHDNWPALAGTVRGDDPPDPIDETFYGALVRATFPTQHAVATALAPELPRGATVLELGAGGAPWAVALLSHDASAHATVNDLSEVLAVARATTREHGVDDRCEFVPGDYHEIALRDSAYDVVVLGHVLRAEGSAGAGRLLTRAAGALRRGGHVVITDYFVDEDRRGPLNAALLGVTMAAALPDGATYTRSEYESWLTNAGFVAVERRVPVPFQDVLVARKPEESTD